MFPIFFLLVTSLGTSGCFESETELPDLNISNNVKQYSEAVFTETGTTKPSWEIYEAPEELKNSFRYYITGHDLEGSPLCVFTPGVWDLRSFFEREGRKAEEEFEKYTNQMVDRFFNSPLKYPTNESRDDFVLIADLQGFAFKQLTHIPAVQAALRMARRFIEKQVQNERIKMGYIVNSNFLFETLFNLMKPIVGQYLNIVELYGTNTKTWQPVLFKKIDKNQLPDFLGGPSNHKSLEAHG